MTALSGHLPRVDCPSPVDPMVVPLTANSDMPEIMRSKYGYLVDNSSSVPSGFAVYFKKPFGQGSPEPGQPSSICVELPPSLHYLSDGDIVRVDFRQKKLRTLYRRSSRFNYFLLTERCDHYCLMCSQPPKNVNDDWLLDSLLAAIPFISRETPFIGVTGGEPTILGDRFLDLIRRLKSILPQTPVHVLTNGKKFADQKFCADYAAIGHQGVTVGIPIYSDLSSVHDYVVQCDGAFDTTLRGILELKRRAKKVEIRIVISKQTYERLPQFAEFIYRNLTFVDHVAFMGLELTGFAKANIDELWIDPNDYKTELQTATGYLKRRGMNVSIYNHQLCTIDPRSWPLARKSISDWKNEYLPACEGCSAMEQCGGFFTTSSVRRSNSIAAIPKE